MKVVSVQVPGKILLAGEYAVLEGYPALSVAVDRYLQVELAEQSSGGWLLESDLWPKPLNLDTAPTPLQSAEPFLQIARFAREKFAITHAHCRIRSALDVRFGLGSSTALRLGVWYAARLLRSDSLSIDVSFQVQAAREVYCLQREMQTFASGYDALTQAKGGLLFWKPDYETWPGQSLNFLKPERLWSSLRVMVGGRGAPTAKIGQSTLEVLKNASWRQDFFNASQHVTASWSQYLQNSSVAFETVLAALIAHRHWLEKFPYFPQAVFKVLSQLEGFDESWTAKTTGAGGEDALLLIGPQHHTLQGANALAELGWSELAPGTDMRGVRTCERFIHE